MTAAPLLTQWSSLTDPNGTRVATTWPAWFAQLATPMPLPTRPDPRTGHMVPDKRALAGWSAALFQGDRRANEACEAVTALVLDYDGGTTLDQAESLWGRYEGLLHTTPSHQIDGGPDRFRVVLPFERSLAPARYPWLWRWAVAHAQAAGHTLDTVTKDVARLWFLPAALPEAPFEARLLQGSRLDPAQIVGATPSKATTQAAPPRSIQRALDRACAAIRAAPPGQRNDTLNRHAYSLAGWVGAGRLDRATAVDAVREAALAAGLPTDETDRTLQSAFEAGEARPRASNAPPPRSVADVMAQLRANPMAVWERDVLDIFIALHATDKAAFARARSEVRALLGGRVREFDTAVKAARAEAQRAVAPRRPANPDGVPEVLIAPDEWRVADDAITALVARTRNVYQRGSVLVRVQQDEEGAYIVPLAEATLREQLTVSARWLRPVTRVRDGVPGREYEWTHPPTWVVQAIAARGQWPGLPPLRAVVESPVLRPDGSVLCTPGYDPATRLFYAPNGPLPQVPETPTLADARCAVSRLREVVADFPYDKPAHCSAWLAALLTPFARFAFDGFVPLFTFDSNLRGAGKSLQADAIALIVTGRNMPRRAYVADEVELKKTVTSIAAQGAWAVLFDNVATPLGGAALDMALTGDQLEDRLFGRNDVTLRFRLSTIYMASGNNLVLYGDMVRRVLPSRLRCLDEKPEERTGFRHPDLRAWVRTHRTELATAALTVLRAYFVAGSPDLGLRSWGSYEAWSTVVRNALVWLGEPDPGEARLDLPDTARDLTSRLVIGWAESFPSKAVPVAEAVRVLLRPENATRFETLRAALTELADRPLDKASVHSLGKRMERFRDRVVGGWALQKADGGNRGAVWRAVQVTSSTDPAAGPRRSSDDSDNSDDS